MERMYRWLNKERGERVCTGISDEACAYVPQNYFLIIVTNMFTKLGDVLSAPKTVLTWIMGAIGAPIFLTSLLVPIRESGSMLPQVFLSTFLRNLKIRKWGWVFGSLLQALALFAVVLAVIILKDARASIWIVITVAVFALGRALCSLLSKDLIGKTIPKTRRGKLNGYSSSVSGLLVLISGIILLFHPFEKSSLDVLLHLVIIAASLWIVASIFFARVYEPFTETKDAQQREISFLKLLVNDTVLQKFILARGLLISSALLSPFVVLLAQQNIGSDIYLLGLFILAGGIASIVSGPFWGHLADRSSKQVMIIAATIVAVLSLVLFILLYLNMPVVGQVWLYPTMLFILGIAHDGIRLGRKTYIIDIAEGNKRTEYVATSNTVIGILLLVVGGFTAWLATISLMFAVGILMLMVAGGIWVGLQLEEVE